MPPKKKGGPTGPTNKTLEKEKKKVVEDKTFGLKNKNKSKAVQNYVKQVTNQVMDGGTKKVSMGVFRIARHLLASRNFWSLISHLFLAWFRAEQRAKRK